MAYELWMLLLFCPTVTHTQSGGGYGIDDEPSVDCSSLINFKSCNLTCHLDDDLVDDVENITLCSTEQNRKKCTQQKETLKRNIFTFEGLDILEPYYLTIQMKERHFIKQTVNLAQIVKIPTPKIVNATYLESSDRVLVYIGYKHDYVSKPLFQVKIQSTTSTGGSMILNVSYQPLLIEGMYLRENTEGMALSENTEFHVWVRAKPVGYFGGRWSEWSSPKTFCINTTKWKTEEPDVQVLLYTITTISAVLLLVTGLVVLRWKEIKAYISPSIPHPKATLAEMHNSNKGPRECFDPKDFIDCYIHLVDGIDERHLPPESQEGVDGNGVREVSSLRGKLLDGPDATEAGDNNVGSQRLRNPQRECKDEAYVTMSSFYNTQ